MKGKVLIIGASGYIGRHLCAHFNRLGCEVVAGTRSGDKVLGIEQISTVKCDVLDLDSLNEINWDFKAVFAFAGKTGTWQSFEEAKDFVEVNEIGLTNVLESIRQSEFNPTVVFPSSRLVYEGGKIPLSEDAPKESKTIYSLNKRNCENLLETYHKIHNLNYIVFRICVPYGNHFSGEYSYGTVGFFLNQAMAQKNISLFGDGELRRTFTHVDSICAQIVGVLENGQDECEIYNVAGEDLSLKEAATIVANRFGVQVAYADWPEHHLKIESGSTVFDSRKIENVIRNVGENDFKKWLSGVESQKK